MKYISKHALFLGLVCLCVVGLGSRAAEKYAFEPETPVWDVLTALGRVKVNTPHDSLGGASYSATQGKELVEQGYTNKEGRRSSKISRGPNCATCHAQQNEYPKLAELDPVLRLRYLDSLNRPLLMGPPLEGMVNRIFFFMDDYQERVEGKYAELFKQGHRGLRQAIQTCNQVYAQGRELESWEVESILSYLWTLELKMSQLQLSDDMLQSIQQAVQEQKSNARAVNIMRQNYLEVYPAHFGELLEPEVRKRISPVLNSFEDGYILYKRSCLHCHGGSIRGIGYGLDESRSNFQVLRRHFDDPSSRHSIYNVLRYNPEYNKGNSLPHFTEERLSLEQIQNLRFYIYEMARLGEEAYLYHKVAKRE